MPSTARWAPCRPVELLPLVALILATVAATATACSPPPVRTVPASDIRPFEPSAPRPSRVEPDPYGWKPAVSTSGRYAVYTEGGRQDVAAYLWNREKQELTHISNHVNPRVEVDVAVDGESAIVVEQRDPETKSDGVNRDALLGRIARWDRPTRSLTALSEFRDARVVDVAASLDRSTIAYIANGHTFVVAAD